MPFPNDDLTSMPSQKEDNDTVAIHVPKRDFGNFIKSLLGQPYEISRRLGGQFDINQDFVNQLIYLLDQRISSQHKSVVVEFTGSLYIEDGLEKKFSTEAAFVSLVHTGPEITTGISFTITYLIYFHDSDIPSKQTINLRCGRATSKIGRSFVSDIRLYELNSFDEWGPLSIEYRIECTERSWGEDVERIIFEQFQKVSVPVPRHTKIFENIKPYIIGLIGISAVIVPFIAEYFRAHRRASEIVIPRIEPNETIHSSLSKLYDLLYQYMVIGPNTIFIMYYISYILISIGIIVLLGVIGSSERRSLVVYGSSTEKLRKEFRRKQSINPFIFLFTFLVQIALAIIANYLFVMFQ